VITKIRVKVEVIGHGRVLGSKIDCPRVRCTDDIARGNTLSLQARAETGAQFSGWSTRAGTCSTRAERCTFPVFKDSQGQSPLIVASFRRPPQPLPPPPP